MAGIEFAENPYWRTKLMLRYNVSSSHLKCAKCNTTVFEVGKDGWVINYFCECGTDAHMTEELGIGPHPVAPLFYRLNWEWCPKSP